MPGGQFLKYTENILLLVLSGYYDLGFKRKHYIYPIADVKQALKWLSFNNRKWNLKIEHKHFYLKKSKVYYFNLVVNTFLTFFGGNSHTKYISKVVMTRKHPC